jgi:hypothetical protein
MITMSFRSTLSRTEFHEQTWPLAKDKGMHVLMVDHCHSQQLTATTQLERTRKLEGHYVWKEPLNIEIFSFGKFFLS